MKTHTNVNHKPYIGFGLQTSVRAGACSIFPPVQGLAQAIQNGNECSINPDGSIGCCSTKPVCTTHPDGSMSCVLG
jgi:hypothetical protein